MFDEANAIKTMLDMRGVSRSALSKSLGVSESCIANKLRLLKLSEPVRAAVIQNGLAERHARLLLRLPNEDSQLKFIKEIASRCLTVSEAEACIEINYLKDITKPASKQKIPRLSEARDAFIQSVTKGAESLTSLGGYTKVTVSHHDKKSYITIIINN